MDIVAQFLPPPPPPPRSNAHAPPPPGVVALLGFEGTDDGVTSQRAANNGSWMVSVPDARAAHSGGSGLYVEVSKAWRVASLARLLLPRYVPRAGKAQSATHTHAAPADPRDSSVQHRAPR